MSRAPRLRAFLVAAFAIVVLALFGPIGLAQDPAPGVRSLGIRATGPHRRAMSTPWVLRRVSEVVEGLDARCYQAALASRPGASGELVVRATLGRTGGLTGVSATRSRGGTLTTGLATCVRRAFASTALAMTPLPRPPEELEVGAQYVETNRDPPSAAELPIRLEVHIVFTAPPQQATPPVTPDPPTACRGGNPEGCHSHGCPDGMRCDTHVRCVPSSCACNASNGAYVCTSDCGGGVCVPTR